LEGDDLAVQVVSRLWCRPEAKILEFCFEELAMKRIRDLAAQSCSIPSLVFAFSLGMATIAAPPAAWADDAPPAAPAAPSAADKVAQENMFWDSAQRSNSVADYKAYLDAFPNGVYAPLARNRISAMMAPASAPPAAQPPSAAAAATAPTPVPIAEVGTAESEQSLNLTSDNRSELQERLQALGLYSGAIDGVFGAPFRTAVAEWQKRHGATQSGFLGPLQLAALKAESDAVANSSAPDAAQGNQAPQSAAAPNPAAQPAPAAPVSPEALKGEIGTVETEQALGLGPQESMDIQQRLTALGLYAGPIDGDLGAGSRAAIAEWQRRHNAAPTSELGPMQLAALRAEGGAPYQAMAPAPVYGQPVYAVRRYYYPGRFYGGRHFFYGRHWRRW
jgi:peptidoglycan hydrolase-like protein with peptidoglycan-binding domain